ncbi:hypothetical protein CLOHYLEM_06404 [[Clostridium] hylemonae DSM 15053]|uniref:Uncharacterized protein n=1 Tax=[Clostridium] hylemonae DSM 15053 TaxID=553973 RepID=C0C2U8_9FIRM|nr:hypothetical protein CLOHYLEM_06404 [[Clostridium] hylemonae DSM 15053]
MGSLSFCDNNVITFFFYVRIMSVFYDSIEDIAISNKMKES